MELLYLSKKSESDSLESRLMNHNFKNKFMNSAIRITDIILKYHQEGFIENDATEENKFYENISGTYNTVSTDIIFNMKNNEILVTQPKIENDILNIFHAISLYYEINFKNQIRDGIVDQNFNIFDKKGNLQKIIPPKIKFVQKIEDVNIEIILDHPSRLDTPASYPLDDSNVKFLYNYLKENNSFLSYNQGTDFIFLEKNKNSLIDIFQNFSDSLQIKSGQLIKYILKKNEHLITNIPTDESDSNTRYIDHLPLEEKIKIVKKHIKLIRNKEIKKDRYTSLETILINEMENNDSFKNRVITDYYKYLIQENDKKSKKNANYYFEKLDLYKKIYDKEDENYNQLINEIINYFESLKLKEKNINNINSFFNKLFLDFFEISKIGEEKNKLINEILNLYHLSLEDAIDKNVIEEGFLLAKKYGLWQEKKITEEEIKDYVLKNKEEYIKNAEILKQIFINLPERRDLIESNKEEFKKYIIDLSNKNSFENLGLEPTIIEWLEYYPELINFISKQKIEEHIDFGIESFFNYGFKPGYAKYSSSFGIYKKINFKKIKYQLQKDANKNFSNKLTFTKEEIFNEMDDKTFFVVPIFVKEFKNKQYRRLINQLNEFNIPHVTIENYTLIYDTRKALSIYREIIPEKLRKEFKINPLDSGKHTVNQRFYGAKKNEFADLSIYIK